MTLPRQESENFLIVQHDIRYTICSRPDAFFACVCFVTKRKSRLRLFRRLLLDVLYDVGNSNSRRYYDHHVYMVYLHTEFYYLGIEIKLWDMRKRLGCIFLDILYEDLPPISRYPDEMYSVL